MFLDLFSEPMESQIQAQMNKNKRRVPLNNAVCVCICKASLESSLLHRFYCSLLFIISLLTSIFFAKDNKKLIVCK